MWGPSLWLVCKCYGPPFLALSHTWDNRWGARERHRTREGSSPQIDGFCTAWKKHCFPLAAPPEWGTKISELSQSLVAAFCWLLPSYLWSKHHFQVSGMTAREQAVCKRPQVHKEGTVQPWRSHTKVRVEQEVGFPPGRGSSLPCRANKFLGGETGRKPNQVLSFQKIKNKYDSNHPGSSSQQGRKVGNRAASSQRSKHTSMAHGQQ